MPWRTHSTSQRMRHARLWLPRSTFMSSPSFLQLGFFWGGEWGRGANSGSLKKGANVYLATTAGEGERCSLNESADSPSSCCTLKFTISGIREVRFT